MARRMFGKEGAAPFTFEEGELQEHGNLVSRPDGSEGTADEIGGKGIGRVRDDVEIAVGVGRGQEVMGSGAVAAVDEIAGDDGMAVGGEDFGDVSLSAAGFENDGCEGFAFEEEGDGTRVGGIEIMVGAVGVGTIRRAEDLDRGETGAGPVAVSWRRSVRDAA